MSDGRSNPATKVAGFDSSLDAHHITRIERVDTFYDRVSTVSQGFDWLQITFVIFDQSNLFPVVLVFIILLITSIALVSRGLICMLVQSSTFMHRLLLMVRNYAIFLFRHFSPTICLSDIITGLFFICNLPGRFFHCGMAFGESMSLIG